MLAQLRQLVQIPFLLMGMLLFGATGIRMLTNQAPLDCLYQALHLMTTVDSLPEPLTPATKIFVMVYLSGGLGIFTFSAFQIGQTIVSGDFRHFLEKRRMESRISGLTDHFIICGYGRMGATLCDYLSQRRKPFVIIDEDEDLLKGALRECQWLHVVGDATQDETLMAAGIERARALTTVLSTDADNLYVVLSAHLLAADLQIVARASNDRAAQKMTQAGATRVINPLFSGATRMARFMLTPSLENFVEVAEAEGVDWEIADVQIPDDSPLVERRLSETSLRDSGIMLLGVRRCTGERFFPPPATLSLKAGDNLFAFGSTESMATLSSLIDPPAE